MHRRFALPMLALLIAVPFAGCAAPQGDGSASVYVKDAPTDEFDEIHVVFTEVRIHAAGNGTDDDNATAGWITLFEDAAGVDVDLLNASGTRAAFLGEADLAAGRYTQIRVIVSEAYGITADGERIDFDVPSGTLKVVRSFEVEAGKESRIVLDFDLDRSLKQAGPQGWKMTPVIGKTTVEVVEDDESGAEAQSPGETTDLGATA